MFTWGSVARTLPQTWSGAWRSDRGSWLAHPAAMNRTTKQTQHQLDDLRREWSSLRRSHGSRHAALGIVEHHATRDLGALGVVDLGDIVTLLEPEGPLNQLERAQLAATLLERAPTDPLIARALLQTILPGIVSVARRLRWGQSVGEEPAVFLADLITSAYELIVEWGGQCRPYAVPDLLNALRCRMRRRMETEVHHTGLPLDRPDGCSFEPRPCIDDDPLASLEAMIAELGEDCDKVGATALIGREVLGLTYRELAEMTGYSTRSLSRAGREVARRILG